MSASRNDPKAPPAWLLALDRALSLRGFAWFRRSLGGAWELHAAPLIPGAPESWHRVGLDSSPRHSIVIAAREVYP